MTDKPSLSESEWQRLARYYAGEASPEEQEAVQSWIDADPARARMVGSMREVWNLSTALPPLHHGNRQRAWERVASQMNGGAAAAPQQPAPGGPEPVRPPASKRRWVAEPWWRSSRAALLAAAVLMLALVPLFRGPLLNLLQQDTAPLAMREFVTGKGERIRFTLGDGSVVELASDSRLGVPTDLQGETREVQLEGMAFFEVAHDPGRPFVVHAREAVTRVLGTQFVVRAFAGEDAVQVAVVEGRVALGPNSAPRQEGTILVGGQLGRHDHEGMTSVIQDRDLFDRLVGWTNGRLEFNDRPLSEVVADLALWYGVEIEVPSPVLASQPVSTVVEGDSLHQVLDMIALVLDARYYRVGDRIVISPR